MGQSDQELLRLARDGDRVAAERLLFSHASHALALIRKDLPPDVARRVSAEDILQESLICAFRGLASLEQAELSAFASWFLQIVKRKHLDAIKQHKALKRSPEREAQPAHQERNSLDQLLIMAVKGGATPSKNLRSRENAAALYSAMAMLSDEYRKAIEFR